MFKFIANNRFLSKKDNTPTWLGDIILLLGALVMYILAAAIAVGFCVSIYFGLYMVFSLFEMTSGTTVLISIGLLIFIVAAIQSIFSAIMGK